MSDFKFMPGESVRHDFYGKGKVLLTDVNKKGERYYRIHFPQCGPAVDIFNESSLHTFEETDDNIIKALLRANRLSKKEAPKCNDAPNPEKKAPEAVNHPSHYNVGKIEVIDFIEDKELGFNLGNAVKYIARCQHKAGGSKRVEDLKKAIWYCQRQISRWEKEEVAE